MEAMVLLVKRERGHAWKGGRSLMNNGYVRVWAPEHPMANNDGYALEHRMVLWDVGTVIPSGFHVHHRNGNRTDNRVENLEVASNSHHRKGHMAPGNPVSNGSGVWTVHPDDEARAEKKRRDWRAYYYRNRERLAARKKERTVAGKQGTDA